ncbi:MAG TPA: hypothetical protein VNB94_13110 [Mycobacteriales bacterium]|nr:hypothetical protein [Mycobacteriales bacterium]
MNGSDSVVAFVPHEAGALPVAEVLRQWFRTADVRAPDRALPWHVVGCEAAVGLATRDWVALARRAYAAGATEVWLVPIGAETGGRLLPRLVTAA